MKIIYIDRNGRRYAYTSTSHRVPGKKNPVSDRVYLGVVDPETGEIIPKKNSNTEQLRFSHRFLVKNYGDVALISAIANRMGIFDTLDTVFGDVSQEIKAIIISQAIRMSSVDSIPLTVKFSYICEILGIDSSGFNEKKIQDVMKHIDDDAINNFTISRFPKNLDRLFVYCLRIPLTNEEFDFLLEVSEISKRNKICIAVLTTDKGVVTGFRVINDPIEDPSDLIDVICMLKNILVPVIFISDPIYSSRMDFTKLIRKKIDFIAGFPINSEQFSHLLKQIDLETIYASSTHHKSRTCLCEINVGMPISIGTSMIIAPNEPRFGGCRTHLKVMLIYDPQIAERTRKQMNDIVNTIKRRLEGKVSLDPDRTLRINAGIMADFFRINCDYNGVMHISVRRNKMSEFRKTAGMTFVLTSSSDWNTVDTARRARLTIDHVKNQLFYNSDWVQRYSRKNADDVRAMMFIDYVVMTIYGEIQTVASESGIDFDVKDILYKASYLKKIITPTGTYTGSPDRSLEKFLAKFGVASTDMHDSSE